MAGLVTLLAHVDLQGFHRAGTQRPPADLDQFLFE
jgi:hypothetical protein